MHSEAKELYLRLNERIIDGYERTGSKPGCRSKPELFFPEDFFDYSDRAAVETWARTLCGKCPVANLCLEYALTARETSGIWGGMTARERADLLRKK